MTGKRKAALELHYDDRLTVVTRALANLKRPKAGDKLTSGACEAFPLPVLRLCGDAVDLPLPLTPHAVDAIERTANSCTATRNDHAWVVESEAIEVRNPRWAVFVETLVEAVRAPLGITDAARLSASLKGLVLVRPGGRLPFVQQSMERRTVSRLAGQMPTQFGSLLVVLPSEFTGGEIMTRSRDGNDEKKPLQWRPGAEGSSAYDIRYSAYYNHSRLEMTAVASGHALFLLYDLATTTIHELPRFAGTRVLADQVEIELTRFFAAVPPSTSKRLKIHEDALRTIHEFTTDHRLVYPVPGETFKTLAGDEQQIAERLAAFCAHSNGQYVLYLAALGGCMWSTSRDKETTYSISLNAPWIKYRHSQKKLPFADTKVAHCLELAPVGFLERLKHRKEDGSVDADAPDVGYSYRYFSDGGCHCHPPHGHALVVQPAALEVELWAQLPIEKIVARLKKVVTTFPAEASRVARRALTKQRMWTNTDLVFVRFLKAVETLMDAPLFNDLLQSVSQFEYDDSCTLADAVHQFGWDSCGTTIERIIQKTTTTFRSRVNVICSVLNDRTETTVIERLLRTLAPLLPWAPADRPLDCTVDLYDDESPRRGYPTKTEFFRLLSLAYQSSSPAMLEILLENVNAGSFTFHVIVPCVKQLLGDALDIDRSRLLRLLRSLRNMIESSMPVLRNADYARQALEGHCNKCYEIQAFLLSPVQNVTLVVRNTKQFKHVETVVKRKVHRPGRGMTVAERTLGTAELFKENLGSSFSTIAEESLQMLADLLSEST